MKIFSPYILFVLFMIPSSQGKAVGTNHRIEEVIEKRYGSLSGALLYLDSPFRLATKSFINFSQDSCKVKRTVGEIIKDPEKKKRLRSLFFAGWVRGPEGKSSFYSPHKGEIDPKDPYREPIFFGFHRLAALFSLATGGAQTLIEPCSHDEYRLQRFTADQGHSGACRGVIKGFYEIALDKQLEDLPTIRKELLNQTREENERQVSFGDHGALARQIEGYGLGKWGYVSDYESLAETLQKLFSGFEPKHILQQARVLLRISPEALEVIHENQFFQEGVKSFSQNLEKYVRLVLATKDKKKSKKETKEEKYIRSSLLTLYAKVYARGIPGFIEQDKGKAKEVIEELKKQGDPKAFDAWLKGLLYGDYGYEQNIQEAERFMDATLENKIHDNSASVKLFVINRSLKYLLVGAGKWSGDPVLAYHFFRSHYLDPFGIKFSQTHPSGYEKENYFRIRSLKPFSRSLARLEFLDPKKQDPLPQKSEDLLEGIIRTLNGSCCSEDEDSEDEISSTLTRRDLIAYYFRKHNPPENSEEPPPSFALSPTVKNLASLEPLSQEKIEETPPRNVVQFVSQGRSLEEMTVEDIEGGVSVKAPEGVASRLWFYKNLVEEANLKKPNYQKQPWEGEEGDILTATFELSNLDLSKGLLYFALVDPRFNQLQAWRITTGGSMSFSYPVSEGATRFTPLILARDSSFDLKNLKFTITKAK